MKEVLPLEVHIAAHLHTTPKRQWLTEGLPLCGGPPPEALYTPAGSTFVEQKYCKYIAWGRNGLLD